MIDEIVASDANLMDVMRRRDDQSVSELATAMEVTATAVRQRLNRLMAHGDVERTVVKSGRGRPSHQYSLTTAGRRRAGTNFVDLAVALWEEISSIDDSNIRRGLLQRISKRMSAMYAGRIKGEDLEGRMQSLVEHLTERNLPFDVDTSGDLPILRAQSCPYPGLAEQDRSVCAMERMLFSELLGEQLKLTDCRLDGDACCTFEPKTN